MQEEVWVMVVARRWSWVLVLVVGLALFEAAAIHSVAELGDD